MLLKDVVEIAIDWDVADRDAAKQLTIRQPPGNGLLFIAQYRERVGAKRQFGTEIETCNEYQFAAIQVQSGVVNVYPSGPLGIAAIYIRPEAAIPLFGSLKDFANIKVDLRDIFQLGELERLHERLAQSQQSSERIAHIETFLVRNARGSSETSVAQHAAKLLAARPGRRLSRLATEMNISERHLTRVFRQSFGISPKRFTKIARIEKVLASRRDGLTWTEAAYACGFCDQSHMIRDFKEIVGKSPVEFFRPSQSGTELLVGGSNLTFSITESQRSIDERSTN
jgi:AraC-like DNA-binding protein